MFFQDSKDGDVGRVAFRMLPPIITTPMPLAWNDEEEAIIVDDDSESSDEYQDSDASSATGYVDDDGQQDDDDDDDDESSEDEAVVQEDEQAEKEIEGDFNRLVEDIRQLDSNDASNLLTRYWDINIAEENAEFHDDLRAASGIGRRRRKQRQRGSGPALSHQVKALIGDGNQAYVDGNTDEAIHIMQEVIRIEPRATSAWTVLARCYEDMKQPDRALKLSIMAAHLRHDSEEWLRLAIQSRALGYNQQALYCYRKLYALDPGNVDALWDRATLAKEINDLRTARHAYLAILKRFPHDMNVLDNLQPILVELGDLKTCADAFQSAFEHYHNLYPNGPPASGSGPVESIPLDPALLDPGPSSAVNTVNITEEEETEPSEAGRFKLLHILVLADLWNTLGQYESAVSTIRKGVRWLQGRRNQAYWDQCPDDREYDTTGIVRQVGKNAETVVSGGVDGDDGAASGSGTDGQRDRAELQPGRYPLDVNARHRLAIARIKLGDIDEGKIHASQVLSEDAQDYSSLFVELADAYFEREIYAEARPIYELLGSDAGTSSMYILLQFAACLRALNELRDAAEVYEYIRTADPTHNDAKMKLAEIYEILNEPKKAWDLVMEVIDARKRQKDKGSTLDDQEEEEAVGDAPANTSGTLFVEGIKGKGKQASGSAKNIGPTRAQLIEMEAEKEKEVIRGWKRVSELWRGMLLSFDESKADVLDDSRMDMDEDEKTIDPGEAEREWMVEGEKLVETFRETRALFSTGKHHFRGMFPRRNRPRTEEDEQRMASRLALDLGNTAQKGKKGKKAVDDERVMVFRGVHFDDWLKLFLQYAFNLTRRNQYALADEVLRHVMLSKAYDSQEYQDIFRIAIITCAIYVGQYPTIVEQCRKMVNIYQFNNEPYRILLASLSAGLHATDAFVSVTFMKHLLREVKISDIAVKNPSSMKWVPSNRRWAVIGGTKAALQSSAGGAAEPDKDAEVDEEEGGEPDAPREAVEDPSVDNSPRSSLPDKPNPMITSIYGQVCLGARSYQSAIFYFLHAYDHVPEDPLVCLCLGIASIGRSMQRQADNRHHLIIQGMAFLTKYRQYRGNEAEKLSEVEYNFGRAFHQLGLLSQALVHYERVFEIAEKMADKTNVGLAKEAAYNAAMIYVTTGATPLAEKLYRRWLTI